MNVQNVLPKDAIQGIDDPAFGADFFGDPEDEVIVVDSDQWGGTEPPRAYPIRVLSHHEIVNDRIGDRPVAVTWCPICWSAVVYDSRMGEQTLTFGVSGKLADDALVMYDRETDSEWKQPTGECIGGEFEGERLHALDAPIVTWERFRTEYPDGVGLQPVRGTGPGQSPRDHYDMTSYERYVESEEFGLFGMRGEGPRRSWDREDIDAKNVVLGVEIGSEAVGYPIPSVEAAGGVVTDSVGDRGVVVFAGEAGIHAFADPGYDFEMREDMIHTDGTTWNPATGESADGRGLDRVPARRLFAFAWQDAHGPDAFY